jgi:hypothetical protein
MIAELRFKKRRRRFALPAQSKMAFGGIPHQENTRAAAEDRRGPETMNLTFLVLEIGVHSPA